MQYFADTPPGAWAELLRHEEITDPADLAGIWARLWVVEIGDVQMHEPKLPGASFSSPDGYEVCRVEARRLRAAGAERMMAISAALAPGEGAGFHVGTGGLIRASARDGRMIVHFGVLPDAQGWCAAEAARPDEELLNRAGRCTPVSSRWGDELNGLPLSTIQAENTRAPLSLATRLCALPRGLKKPSPARSVLSGWPRTFQMTAPCTM